MGESDIGPTVHQVCLALLIPRMQIFIIEGVLSCAVAFLGFMFLLSFPDNTKSRSLTFLHPDELRYVIARVNRDRADAHLEPFQIKKFLASALDWKIWCFAFIFGSITTVTSALAYFLPIVSHEPTL